MLAVSDTDTLWVYGDGSDEVSTMHSGWPLVEMNVAESDDHEYNHYTSTVGSSIVRLMVAEDIVTQHIVHT